MLEIGNAKTGVYEVGESFLFRAETRTSTSLQCVPSRVDKLLRGACSWGRGASVAVLRAAFHANRTERGAQPLKLCLAQRVYKVLKLK